MNDEVKAKKIRAVKPKRAEAPTHEDPRKELDMLVRQHRALQKLRVQIGNASADRVVRHVDNAASGLKKGDRIPCYMPDVAKELNRAHCKAIAKQEEQLERAMVKQLRKVRVYSEWLEGVFGFGPIACAYLISSIDIRIAEKSSALRRFCGLAVINGRLERRTAGQKNAYNSALRVKLYSAFMAMIKNGAAHDKGCKYLQVWSDAKHRKTAQNEIAKAADPKCKVVAPHKYGWHKAADVFVEDLYTVWRALEGLPVWPSYYAAKLGYEHGGKISVNAPKLLTLDEAIALVGEVGGTPGKIHALYNGVKLEEIADEVQDEDLDIAAEE